MIPAQRPSGTQVALSFAVVGGNALTESSELLSTERRNVVLQQPAGQQHLTCRVGEPFEAGTVESRGCLQLLEGKPDQFMAALLLVGEPFRRGGHALAATGMQLLKHRQNTLTHAVAAVVL